MSNIGLDFYGYVTNQDSLVNLTWQDDRNDIMLSQVISHASVGCMSYFTSDMPLFDIYPILHQTCLCLLYIPFYIRHASVCCISHSTSDIPLFVYIPFYIRHAYVCCISHSTSDMPLFVAYPTIHQTCLCWLSTHSEI